MRGWLVVACLLASQSAAALTLFQPNVDAVKAGLADPYSAQFEGVEKVGNGAICGTVNSKNDHGAYSGRKEFAIVGGEPYIEGSGDDQIIVYCITGRDCKDAQCVDDKAQQLAKDKRSKAMAAVIGDKRLQASATCQAHLPASADKMMSCNSDAVVCRNKSNLADEADCLDDVIKRHKT